MDLAGIWLLGGLDFILGWILWLRSGPESKRNWDQIAIITTIIIIIIIIVIIITTIITILSECNTETSETGTYFTNPMSLSSVCSLMIRPMSDQICQVHKVFGRFVSGREIQDEKHPGPP
mgnify:CR=1 FL=1